MSAKPVAWRIRIGDSDGWGYGDAEWQADFYGKQSGVPFVKEPLYAESPAQARALAIQEAARVCERMTERWARRHSPGAMGQMCGLGEGTASECVDAIRALSPAPSVTEEWVWAIATINGQYRRGDSLARWDVAHDVLAALGVEVTK